ncbi:polyprenyl synthetase family protein [Eubacterium oxidoreducens]|uniref:Farnesyl diphosphate synthase n=1 Tax=Eubacterium oxidoreducens TaxID=1732 RepID=A0A1G6AJX0_EUBOX|nr:farnesyl diphosphate synthase [Eubacterium oxidoreducens]SDB08666.1 geranylgeranyl diphosphate synthase, type II [Eubacterium oxidoreducens]
MELQIAKHTKEVEEIICRFLPKEEGYQKTVLSAMNYSFNAGGKRLRPMLMLEVFRLFGGKNIKLVEPFMAAMEMLHTSSLIHDDLPAMDNDEYRRGKKTTHIVYGEAMAILAGDGLLLYAFETAAKAYEVEPENKNIGKALSIFAQKAGIYGMVGGQTVDVEMEGKPLSQEQLLFIHHLKTGALIEASMMIGAILAEASDEDVLKIQKIASNIGLAFQIQDDILDVMGDEEMIGKPVGSDCKNNKTTYVSLKGIEQSHADVERYTNEAVGLLDSLHGANEFLKSLLMALVNRKK